MPQSPPASGCRGQDDLLEMDRGGQSHFFHNDLLGNVRKVTDSAGNILEQYRYGDYGQSSFFDVAGVPLAGTQIGNATLFTGRRYDPETGLYYYRSRYLDPAAGRFISRDRIGVWGDRHNYGNGFAYAGNNPWSCLDPLGMTAGDPIPGIDVSLDQIPGGYTAPEPDTQTANNYNSAKSNTAGFAASGSTGLNATGDPIPGIDVSLDQIPGGIPASLPRGKGASIVVGDPHAGGASVAFGGTGDMPASRLSALPVRRSRVDLLRSREETKADILTRWQWPGRRRSAM